MTSTLKAQELRGRIGQDSYLAIKKLARGIFGFGKRKKKNKNEQTTNKWFVKEGEVVNVANSILKNDFFM